MTHHVRRILAIGVVACLPCTPIFAGEPDDKSPAKASPSDSAAAAKSQPAKKSRRSISWTPPAVAQSPSTPKVVTTAA